MEQTTTPQTNTTTTATSEPAVESSHKNLVPIISAVVGGVVIVAAFVGMYMWQQSVAETKINEITAQKATIEQEVATLKGEVTKEKEYSQRLMKEVEMLTPLTSTEDELLALFKRMAMYKNTVSATSTVGLLVLQKTEVSDAYRVAVSVDCKEGATEEENKGCAGIEKFYKRANGTWMIVGSNEACPADTESQALCKKAGF